MVTISSKVGAITFFRIAVAKVSRAKALPGVVAVITGKDFPIPYGILPVSEDEHALCIEKVRFIGDPVAAIAAIVGTVQAAARECLPRHVQELRILDEDWVEATGFGARLEPVLERFRAAGGRVIGLSILAPTLYLWLVDAAAISSGTAPTGATPSACWTSSSPACR